MFKVIDFDYTLPNRLIAQEPNPKRDACRLMFLDKKTGKTSHHIFYDIGNFLQKGDVLVFNNSKVMPARLRAYKKTTGGKLEVLLIKSLGDSWECIVGGKVNIGTEIEFLNSKLSAVVVADLGIGLWGLKFNVLDSRLLNIAKKIGEIPLPPYIKRDQGANKNDNKYYQTVYANNCKLGSAAAPTAGLHFTPRLMKSLESKGVILVPVTLHVGLGTFAPLKVDSLKDIRLHKEFVEISKTSWDKIKKAKRVIAVGTTSVRSLEAAASNFLSQDKQGNYFGETNIFISPGYKFKVVDGLVTNFHLPKSSLMMLVSALAGRDNILSAYNEAINNEYRFFSFGEAMIII
jgi:S-adenosylmethionine:tRNA ribosyltransferase-isomerase